VNKKRRSGLAGGLLLIILGVWFLAVQLVPGLGMWVAGAMSWPSWIIGVGLLLLVFGLLTGTPAMAIPACIVGGIGGVLYWQNVTGNWESWSYVWALIPGFVGIGSLLAGLLGENRRESIRSGITLIVISLILLLIFGSFLGNWRLLGPYWPVLLIVLGVVLLLRILLR
jgi:hypothetical protein